jgi:hypothetical protein
MKTDLLVLAITEGFLILLFVFAISADIRNRWKAKTASVTAEVSRGEKSMNALYVNFGIATVVFTVIVQACEALKGNRVLFIIVNYGLLTYMFFFSSWFRNQLFFKLLNRVRKD